MRIVENDRSFLADFVRLNEEWISHYFELEEPDRELARNPGKVIEDGGYIFSLLVDGEVVGTCALFHYSEDTYELARMAVSLEHQGNGYGKSLMEASLLKLEEIKAAKVFLTTNTKLEAAINLYKRYGFEVTSEGQHPDYSRGNVIMERIINS